MRHLRVLSLPLLSLALSGPLHAAANPLPALIDAVSQRLAIADQVARSKLDTGKPVLDETREQQVLQSVQRAAADRGVPTATARTFFSIQMEANKLIQYGLLDAWRRQHHIPPPDKPDLSKLRSRLDELQGRLLDGLAATAPLRQDKDCQAKVDQALTRYQLQHWQDSLHRLAQVRALGDFCNLPD